MNFLTYIDNDLLVATPAANLYEQSPFKDLRKLPPKTKGSRFEKIAKRLLEKVGYEVEAATSKGHDIILDGVKTEIKGATLSNSYEEEFSFKFMQIRMEDDWDQLLLMAFWPLDVRMYLMSKEDVQKYIDCGAIKRQHGGKDGDNDTFIFIGYPDDLLYAREVDSLVDNPKKAELKVVG